MEGAVVLEPEEDGAEDGAGSTEKNLRRHQSFHSNRTALSLWFFLFFVFLFFFTLVFTPTLCCLLSDLFQSGGGLLLDSAPSFLLPPHTQNVFLIDLTSSGPTLSCCPFILIAYFCRSWTGCRKNKKRSFLLYPFYYYLICFIL